MIFWKCFQLSSELLRVISVAFLSEGGYWHWNDLLKRYVALQCKNNVKPHWEPEYQASVFVKLGKQVGLIQLNPELMFPKCVFPPIPVSLHCLVVRGMGLWDDNIFRIISEMSGFICEELGPLCPCCRGIKIGTWPAIVRAGEYCLWSPCGWAVSRVRYIWNTQLL